MVALRGEAMPRDSAVPTASFACAVLWATEDDAELARLVQRATDERFVLTPDALRYGECGRAVRA